MMSVCGTLRSQAVFYALSFFPELLSRTGWPDGFAGGTVAQIMDNFDEIMYNFNHVRESIRTDHVVRLAASGM